MPPVCSCACRGLVRVRLGGPPAAIGVARDPGRVQQRGAAVGERVVGAALGAKGPRVFLRGAVEAGAVRIADLLPDPPAIIRPYLEDVAVAVAEQDELRR